jgi:hypothetical protein
MALALKVMGGWSLGADLGGTPSRQLRSVNGLVSDSATTDVILKMKRFPLLFSPRFPCYAEIGPVIFFEEIC